MPLKLLGDPQGLWHGGSFNAEAAASSNGHPVCRGLSYKPMCPRHHKPSLLRWRATNTFFPPVLSGGDGQESMSEIHQAWRTSLLGV